MACQDLTMSEKVIKS